MFSCRVSFPDQHILIHIFSFEGKETNIVKLLFERLDHASCKENMFDWKELSRMLKGARRQRSGVVWCLVENCWSTRKEWWPKYHFAGLSEDRNQESRNDKPVKYIKRVEKTLRSSGTSMLCFRLEGMLPGEIIQTNGQRYREKFCIIAMQFENYFEYPVHVNTLAVVQSQLELLSVNLHRYNALECSKFIDHAVVIFYSANFSSRFRCHVHLVPTR